MRTGIECPRCEAMVDPAALLARIGGFYPGMSFGGATCPACGQSVEFRVGAGELELGFTYWAGSLHFESITRARVAGISIVGEGDQRAVELDGTTYVKR